MASQSTSQSSTPSPLISTTMMQQRRASLRRPAEGGEGKELIQQREGRRITSNEEAINSYVVPATSTYNQIGLKGNSRCYGHQCTPLRLSESSTSFPPRSTGNRRITLQRNMYHTPEWKWRS
uniref:Uncharacterized protein n=1 Tax=Picea glauca TaxID=3330 RepID=A0A101M1N7_PICGL|nr:hypothetical protein ABT39_MTgene3960 [Picea glauca]